jgi:two-component system, NarL family, sensor histidine kinase UhpB
MARKTRILVIEDDPNVREEYSILLRTEGYEVSEASTGVEGLRIFCEKHPQLVFLDVTLPDEDPQEVCRLIKADTSRPEASVVLVSGRDSGQPGRVRELEIGADDFLVTPVASSELLARVRSILRLRQTTGALRASEQYYRRLIEILPDSILLSNLQGHLLRANPQSVAMLGYADELDLIQKSAFDLVLPEQHDRLSALFGETLAGEVMRNQELVLLRKNGSLLPVEISTASLDTAQGHALTLVLVVRDISFRKEAEAAAQKSRFLRKAILDNIPDPAWLKDAQGCFLACNEAMANFYGKRVEDIVGTTVFELPVSREHANESEREDAEVMRSGKAGRFEGERIDLKGNKKWFESVKTPLLSEDGECIGTVGIARDTTERRRLEEELRLLPRRIIEAQEGERFRVARELHDSVNQILASVQMRIRRIETTLGGDRPSTREILARCHDQVITALEENRRIAHGLRPSDLDELGLAISCRNFCREFKTRTNVNLSFSVKGFTERAPRDTELNLFRIVQEALANVEKHARAKNVRLSLVRQQRGIRLTVRDDGRGFEVKPGLAQSRARGGIGLTNIKERAVAMGGTFELKSAPGTGTLIVVRIPVEEGTP